MIAIKAKGDYSKAEGFLKKLRTALRNKKLESYGQMGVDALAAATPKRSGVTAASWFYTIEQSDDSATIIWDNSNVNKYVKIAVILQYGHGTGTGGWVEGRDYINPAIQPIFDEITSEIEREVKGR
jgi:hypothetical protein